MPGRSYRIGRIAGIPVGVSPWWLAIVALFTYVLGSSYFPEEVHGIAPAAAYGLGLASVLLLFASILAHEFGHAIVARRHGIAIEEIDLWLLGGVSRMSGEAHAPGDELRYALAGPAVTAAVAACFGLLALLLPATVPAVVRVLVEYELYVNCAILVLNMLPAFPLDGGRVLRALLWRRRGGLMSATESAARVGRGFGYVLVTLGILETLAGAPSGLWLAMIGFFIVLAAGQEAASTEVRAALSGATAGAIMSSPVVSIPAETPLVELAPRYFVPHRFTSFPVVDSGGRAIGLLTVGALESRLAQGRREGTAGDLAERDPALLLAPGEQVAELLSRPSFARVGRAVVLDPDGAPAGLVSITDVQRALRGARLSRQAA